ncbi:MAG: FliH/SctL family protein [Desulfobulbus sp.]|nr:FliH/SctL family protein [Desulfobulbus sp.]
MNSSKVFKEDTLFIPHSLVRQSIDPPIKAAKNSTAAPEPEALVRKEQPLPDLSQPIVEPPPKPPPKPTQPPKPSPAPEPPPQPPVDIEAIRQEGYAQGAADLAAQMQAKFDQSVQVFANACQKIDRMHSERMANTHADLVNLVISLTEKILGQELATSRNQIALALETALEQAIASEEFHVTLHPDDLAFAKEKAPALISTIRGLEHLVFKADPGIRRGGCLLDSVTCTVDATIDGKLESARELLKEHPELLVPTEEKSGQKNLPAGNSTQDADAPPL